MDAPRSTTADRGVYRHSTSPARCVVCCDPAGATCSGCGSELCRRHAARSERACAACAVSCARCGARTAHTCKRCGDARCNHRRPRRVLCEICNREWRDAYWVAGDAIAFGLILLSPLSLLLWWIAVSGEVAFAIGVFGLAGVWLLGNRTLERRRFLAEGKERNLLAERAAQSDAAD